MPRMGQIGNLRRRQRRVRHRRGRQLMPLTVLPRLFDSNGGCEDFLIEGRHGSPPVGPDGVDRAIYGGDALVVAVLVTKVGAAACFVGGSCGDLDVLGEAEAAIGGARVEDVPAQVTGVFWS